MPQQLFHRLQIGAGVQQVGGKGVAQQVRAHPRPVLHCLSLRPFVPGRPIQIALHDPLHRAPAQPPSASVEKEGARLDLGDIQLEQQLRPVLHIIHERRQRHAADRHDSLFAPLAHHPHRPRLQVQRGEIEPHQLGEANPPSVEQFQDRPIARPGSLLRLGQFERLLHLLQLQGGRRAPLRPRGFDAAGRVASQHALAAQVAEERAHRRQLASDAAVPQAAVVQLFDESGDQLALHQLQRQAHVGDSRIEKSGELLQIAPIRTERMRGVVPLFFQVFEKALDPLFHRGTGAQCSHTPHLH